MKSLREARLEYWRKFRAIERRHRPLPSMGAGRCLMHDDDILGLQLDEVLEGPESMPTPPIGNCEVRLPPLTGIARTMARVRFYAEEGLTDPEVPRIRSRMR